MVHTLPRRSVQSTKTASVGFLRLHPATPCRRPPFDYHISPGPSPQRSLLTADCCVDNLYHWQRLTASADGAFSVTNARHAYSRDTSPVSSDRSTKHREVHEPRRL